MIIIDLLKGLGVTFKQLFRKPVTVQYPEKRKPTAERFMGRHILRRYPDGRERCIGCSLCAAACPADAIYVKASESPPDRPVSPQERYAEVYRIDYIRCIFCGLCEDACPTEALVMGPKYELATDSREKTVLDKEDLLEPMPEEVAEPEPWPPVPVEVVDE